MPDEKKWYQSKTIWGAIVALGAAAAGIFGMQVDASNTDALIVGVTNAATAVGAVLVTLGRIKSGGGIS